MNKVILLGIRDLATEEEIKPQKDYGIFLVGQRISEELEDSDSDDEPVKKYRIKVERVDSVVELGDNKDIKFEKGKSPSEKQRFAIIRELGDDEYGSFMSYLLTKIPQLCEEYRDR